MPQTPDKVKLRNEFKNNPVLKRKADQVDQWIDENIETMDDVRGYLKDLTKAVQRSAKYLDRRVKD